MIDDHKACEYAICLSFLMEGFNNAHGNKYGRGPHGGQYEEHNDYHGGHTGIVFSMYSHACWIENYLATNYPAQDFPGVFHYEVTEELGKWLFDQPPTHTNATFAAHARPLIDEWFRAGLAGQAAHDRANSSMAYSNCLPTATDSTTLNPSQPADENKESTTMKITDLIDTLTRIQDEHGDVDVVIRGSKETSFVDAQEVRAIKTPKRRAVYIGKVSPNRAQE